LHILWARNELIYSLSRGAFKSVQVKRKCRSGREDLLLCCLAQKSNKCPQNDRNSKLKEPLRDGAINNDIYQYVGLIIQLITTWYRSLFRFTPNETRSHFLRNFFEALSIVLESSVPTTANGSAERESEETRTGSWSLMTFHGIKFLVTHVINWSLVKTVSLGCFVFRVPAAPRSSSCFIKSSSTRNPRLEIVMKIEIEFYLIGSFCFNFRILLPSFDSGDSRAFSRERSRVAVLRLMPRQSARNKSNLEIYDSNTKF
jgi:hypothetical protein